MLNQLSFMQNLSSVFTYDWVFEFIHLHYIHYLQVSLFISSIFYVCEPEGYLPFPKKNSNDSFTRLKFQTFQSLGHICATWFSMLRIYKTIIETS